MMNKAISILCPLLLAGASPVFGIGIYVPDQDSEATARANAFTAKADNPSAVYYNPAGLVQLDGFNLSGTLYGTQTRGSFHGPFNVDTQQGIQVLPQAYLTWHGTNKPYALGVGVNTPFGLGVEWGDDSPMRTTIIKDRLALMSISAVGAYQILPQLSIAAGPVFNTGTLTLEQGIAPVDLGDRTKFEGDGHSFGAVAGILVKPVEHLSLGAVYRTSGDINYEGPLTVNPGAIPAFPLPYSVWDGQMHMSIPNQLSLGIGYDITSKLQVEFDAIWTEWSSWTSSKMESTVPGGTPTSVYNWNDSWIFALGATYKLPWEVRVHAGYGYAEATAPDSTYNPLIPDSARHVMSVGISKQWGRHFEGTLTYQHIFGEDRTINNGIVPAGSYGNSSDAISTSFVLKF